MLRLFSLVALTSLLLGSEVLRADLLVMDYNVHGNGVADWSTNSAQVRAIGRQLVYLSPDIVTFQEIPNTNFWQLTNWVKAFMPGYYLATNSATDGFIRSAIASRYPILSSASRLHGNNLFAYGYSGGFTRDLFEAQISVPGWHQPLHVFTTHLKASSDATSALRRAAEASAISNYLVTVYLTGGTRLHPYMLTGDLNEDIFRPPTTTYKPIQRLVAPFAPSTGLRLITPFNPYTASDLTESIQGDLNVRFDYILPCDLLFSNITGSQVFRTDLVPGPPAPLLKYDDVTSSDHLPVLMSFANPYEHPFRLLSVSLENQKLSLQWEAVAGEKFRVEASSNMMTWSVIASNLIATNTSFLFTTNTSNELGFFRIFSGP